VATNPVRCDRWATRVIACAAASVLAASAAAQSTTTDGNRARAIAALDRLMLSGDPLHNSHDEGAWLQAAVHDAFARNDQEIIRLAQRAASPIVVRVMSPIASTTSLSGLELKRIDVLKLPQPVTYTAQVFASIDGGELVPFAVNSRTGGQSVTMPEQAKLPGVHHLRLQARIVYSGRGMPPPETRNLPEVTYALYDPAVEQSSDARLFLRSAGSVPANRLHQDLPDSSLSAWLTAVLSKHATAGKPITVDWLGHFCDERTHEAGAVPRTRDLCSVGYFEVRGTIGQIWVRTGRIEFTDTEVKWLAEPPTFEAMRLQHSSMTEFDDLSVLPMVLDTDPSRWPQPDVSVAPEDITVTRVGTAGELEISAIVRNSGWADVRGVEVYAGAGVDGAQGVKDSVVVVVPQRGQVEVKRRLRFPSPYGVVFVHAMQLSNHGPHESWSPDPTPDDAIAYRIVNPEGAPPGYVARIKKDLCYNLCRGY
jgi:hypothetical protein